MYDLDLSKMVLFGVIALVVIGPKDLPAALRLAGRVVAQLRRVQGDILKAADTLMADASLEREIAMIDSAARVNLALNPATAMRGSLADSGPGLAAVEVLQYATPEMQAYLAPLPEAAPSRDDRLEATQEAR
jgi:sec-independent protein translocase protein TatB